MKLTANEQAVFLVCVDVVLGTTCGTETWGMGGEVVALMSHRPKRSVAGTLSALERKGVLGFCEGFRCEDGRQFEITLAGLEATKSLCAESYKQLKGAFKTSGLLQQEHGIR